MTGRRKYRKVEKVQDINIDDLDIDPRKIKIHPIILKLFIQDLVYCVLFYSNKGNYYNLKIADDEGKLARICLSKIFKDKKKVGRKKRIKL